MCLRAWVSVDAEATAMDPAVWHLLLLIYSIFLLLELHALWLGDWAIVVASRLCTAALLLACRALRLYVAQHFGSGTRKYGRFDSVVLWLLCIDVAFALLCLLLFGAASRRLYCALQLALACAQLLWERPPARCAREEPHVIV